MASAAVTGFVNEFGQPVGRPVPGWSPRPAVGPMTLTGRTCRVEPLGAQHVTALHRSLDLESDPTVWAYYPTGPFSDEAALGEVLLRMVGSRDSAAHVVLTDDGGPVGIASYLRIDPANGSVEVGAIVFSSRLQRTTPATEAMYLMMRHVFDDLGYRRYEWKCDSANAPSRRAAGRLGFSYEGTFRNATVYRGRNRDTAWYSVTAEEWPAVRGELERWLAAENFDDLGRQRTRLDMATALGGARPVAPQDC